MIKALLDLNVASVLRRIEQGDCPTEPALSVETLEHMVQDLARALTPDATQTREAELVTALEPFAEACNISSADDSESLYDTLAAEKLTWRDLRRARAVYNARGGA